MIKAFCDSSYDERKGIAGIGVIVQDGQKRRVYSNWIVASSNNEAELFAIHLASILTEGKGVIYSDSQTAISYINNEIKDHQYFDDIYHDKHFSHHFLYIQP